MKFTPDGPLLKMCVHGRVHPLPEKEVSVPKIDFKNQKHLQYILELYTNFRATPSNKLSDKKTSILTFKNYIVILQYNNLMTKLWVPQRPNILQTNRMKWLH
jgi:hypothetical protein